MNRQQRLVDFFNQVTSDPANPGYGKEVDRIEATHHGYHLILRQRPAVIEGEYRFTDRTVDLTDLMDDCDPWAHTHYLEW